MDDIVLTKQELLEIVSNGQDALDRRLRKVLHEEKGIADEVKRIVGGVVNDIIANKLKILQDKRYSTSSELFGKTIHYNFEIYEFNNQDSEKAFLNTSDSDSGSLYRGDGDLMHISSNILVVNGKIDMDELYDSLYHETSHIFQQKNSKKEYPNPMLYAYAATRINSGDEYERVLANIVYICNTNEQDSFKNGLYGAIMSKLERNDLPIRKSELQAYKKLSELYKDYNFLLENKNNEQLLRHMKKYTKQFGWNYHKFRRRCEIAIYEFEKKINATLEKCQKDAFELGYFANGGQDWLFRMQ